MKGFKPDAMPTELRIEQYYGKNAILQEWEAAPEDLQVKEHEYLLDLRRRLRMHRNYITHRKDSPQNLV